MAARDQKMQRSFVPCPPAPPHREWSAQRGCGRALEAPQVEPGGEGIVVEENAWHGEVVPTSLVLLAALGFRRLTVFKAVQMVCNFSIAVTAEAFLAVASALVCASSEARKVTIRTGAAARLPNRACPP